MDDELVMYLRNKIESLQDNIALLHRKSIITPCGHQGGLLCLKGKECSEYSLFDKMQFFNEHIHLRINQTPLKMASKKELPLHGDYILRIDIYKQSWVHSWSGECKVSTDRYGKHDSMGQHDEPMSDKLSEVLWVKINDKISPTASSEYHWVVPR